MSRPEPALQAKTKHRWPTSNVRRFQSHLRDEEVGLALQRFLGTLIGAAYGLLYLLLFPKISELWNAAVVTGLVGVVLYTTVLIKRKQASYFSCVVFLSIAVNHAKDLNPYLFVWNRCLDTIIGILIGVAVN